MLDPTTIGLVVVKVAWPPRAVTGMALPTPALVYGLGTASVDVFGFEGK